MAAKPPRGRPFAGLTAGLAAGLSRRPQRPVVLGLAGAAAGLIAAAAGLFHPVERELTTVPPGNVALVNQMPVLMSDFISETESATGMAFADTPAAERAKILRNMIDQELMVQRSLALDLPEQDTDVRAAMADGVTGQVNAGVLGVSPTEDALLAFYNAHRANYTSSGSMTLVDLVIHVGGYENTAQTVDQALADAKQAIYELRSGSPLDYVKSHFGLVDSGKVNGEEADFAAKIHLGAKLYAVAQGLSEGELSEPVADTDGVHVLMMMYRRRPVVTDFASVRNNVYTDYVAAQQAKAQAENLKFLRANAKILIIPGQSE